MRCGAAGLKNSAARVGRRVVIKNGPRVVDGSSGPPLKRAVGGDEVRVGSCYRIVGVTYVDIGVF